MSKVYCIQESYTKDQETNAFIPRDLSSAQKFGSVEILLNSQEKGSLSPDTVLNKIEDRLADFNHETDYLCSTGGDPLNIGLVFCILTRWNVPFVKFLRWERERVGGKPTGQGFYIAVQIPLNGDGYVG
jgi:hypothetical protein